MPSPPPPSPPPLPLYLQRIKGEIEQKLEEQNARTTENVVTLKHPHRRDSSDSDDESMRATPIPKDYHEETSHRESSIAGPQSAGKTDEARKSQIINGQAASLTSGEAAGEKQNNLNVGHADAIDKPFSADPVRKKVNKNQKQGGPKNTL